jgi:hypothetical protein
VDEILQSTQYSMRNRPSRTSKNTKFQLLLFTKSFLLQRPRTCSPVYYSSPSRWRSCLQCMLRNFFQTTRAAWDMRLGVGRLHRQTSDSSEKSQLRFHHYSCHSALQRLKSSALDSEWPKQPRKQNNLRQKVYWTWRSGAHRSDLEEPRWIWYCLM